ncbi:MAG: alpha-galactosidase, partial [Ferruginibacter sp.]
MLSFIMISSMMTTQLVAQKLVSITVGTKDQAMVLQTDKENRLGIAYTGNSLLNAAEYSNVYRQQSIPDANGAIANNAYTPSGTFNLLEPALQVTHGDGNNSLELKYISHAVKKIDENVSLTSVVLKDPAYPFTVTLFYKTYFKENVVEQWSLLENAETKPVILKKYASANLFFNNRKFFLTHYHGGWSQEMKPEETELGAGITTLDSKLGTRANLFQPPSFLLSFDKPATETEGTVLLGTLGWTGNFEINFEKDNSEHLRMIAGINHFASEYQLLPGKSFQTPSFIYTISSKGKGDASRNLHTWARKYRLVDGAGSRLTLLNNWEATYFDFNEEKLVKLFTGAKELGVDLFLLDDGWFGNKYPRNDDHAGLGDWKENAKKLPQGIGYLVKKATEAGVKFGIWVEPEMVNPKSELYEKHKDWVLRERERPEMYFRNQLVLDLANPEVQQFVFGIIDSLLIKNPSLAFLKWDCNAVVYNAHSSYLENNHLPQGHLYVDYVNGLYSVLKKLRAKYPTLPMMLCSGGGGRVDYEALKYFTEYWPSDNTDPMERIFIQWENSYFFPAIASCNHVTEASKDPLKFKTDVAMMGKLGFDIVVSQLSEKDRLFAKQAVITYKSISDLVWHGDLYRLVDPHENNIASLMFQNESRGRAVIFTYLTSRRYASATTIDPIKLMGLDPKQMYTVKEINLYPGVVSSIDGTVTYSGDYLMSVGINPLIDKDRSSVILEVTAQK